MALLNHRYGDRLFADSIQRSLDHLSKLFEVQIMCVAVRRGSVNIMADVYVTVPLKLPVSADGLTGLRERESTNPSSQPLNRASVFSGTQVIS